MQTDSQAAAEDDKQKLQFWANVRCAQNPHIVNISPCWFELKHGREIHRAGANYVNTVMTTFVTHTWGRGISLAWCSNCMTSKIALYSKKLAVFPFDATYSTCWENALSVCLENVACVQHLKLLLCLLFTSSWSPVTLINKILISTSLDRF